MTDRAADRLAAFRAELEEASKAVGRAPTLIVVTKQHPVELVRELYDAGQRDFGENRWQEAQPKIEQLGEPGTTWHFVGQLQSKKARQVARAVDVVHSIDREALVDAIDGLAGERVIDGLVQVNLTTDPARGGVAPEGVVALAVRVAASPVVRLRGVMAVAPLGEEPASAFERLAALAERVRGVEPAAEWISAGMSGDWRAALEHGATHLRIGTAITGNRAPRG